MPAESENGNLFDARGGREGSDVLQLISAFKLILLKQHSYANLQCFRIKATSTYEVCLKSHDIFTSNKSEISNSDLPLIQSFLLAMSSHVDKNYCCSANNMA